MKSLSTSLPAHLVERLTKLKLDAGVAGERFNMTELMSAAIVGLPSKAPAVASLIERYNAQLNYGKKRGENGYLDEASISTRITSAAATKIAATEKALYVEFEAKVTHKDLIAVALLAHLSSSD